MKRREILQWMIVMAAVLCCSIFLLGSVVFAERNGPCAQDVEKFCTDVQLGGVSIAKCLREHEKELSQVCKERMARLEQRMQACENDIQKFCKDVQPKGSGIVTCLKDHENELSPECKAKVDRLHKKNSKQPVLQ